MSQRTTDERIRLLTESSNGSAEMPQNRRAGITHLSFDRQLRLDVNLTAPSTQTRNEDTRDHEDR